jgi:hypothetical protein
VYARLTTRYGVFRRSAHYASGFASLRRTGR